MYHEGIEEGHSTQLGALKKSWEGKVPKPGLQGWLKISQMHFKNANIENIILEKEGCVGEGTEVQKLHDTPIELQGVWYRQRTQHASGR